MRYRQAWRRRLRALVAGLLLSLVEVPDLPAGEWESMRDVYGSKLKAQARRIAEIEARERGDSGDQEARADRITRDRISGIRASLPKSGGRGKGLADAAGKASSDAKALGELSREQGEYLAVALIEWGAEGAERRKLREAWAGLSNSLERASASVTRTTEIAETLPGHVSQSGVLDRTARIQSEARNAGDRLGARWQRERALQERQRAQREREAAERERGVR